jgi:hypothetical protein
MGKNQSQAPHQIRSGVISALQQTYRDGNHVNLRAVIAAYSVGTDDDAVADLIDADARLRLDRGMEVALSRYLEAIPELPGLPAALDTAIEMSLRSMVASGLSPAVAAAGLLQRYPGLASAIKTSSTLSQVLCSTEAVRRSLAAGDRVLPRGMGPRLPDGRHRYELRELIGTGSHGAVYLAADRQLSDPDKPAYVAIKVLSSLAPQDEHRLADEAAKARRVDHPAVVRVLDRAVSDDGETFLIYEHVRGGNLESYRASFSGPVPVRDAVQIVCRLADGLQAAHSAGLAHCDIKPANILITEGREPKVADFGVAVRIGAREPELEHRRFGSLAFMAPEQYRAEDGALSPLADVYSLGGLLFWLLTGTYPNGSTPEDVERNLAGGTQRTQAADPTLHRRIDRELAAICRRALEPDPRRRYASAEAFARDLRAWLAFEPIGWTHPSWVRRTRLLARREPLALVLALVAVATAMAGSALAVRIHQRGAEREMQIKLGRAQDQVAMEKESRARFQAVLSGAIRVMSNSGSTDDWLPTMTVLETMFGPALEDAGGPDIWTPRIGAARDLLARAKAAGRENELEPMMWETVLAYWLLRADQPEDAREVLLVSQARWRERFNPGEAWMRDLDAMLACSNAKLALQNHADLAAAAAELEALQLNSDHWHVGRTIQRMVLATQIDLYGQEALNLPSKGKAAAKKLKALQ